MTPDDIPTADPASESPDETAKQDRPRRGVGPESEARGGGQAPDEPIARPPTVRLGRQERGSDRRSGKRLPGSSTKD
jgi:hypothetical protein